jgi:hypothetical protein
MNHAQNAAAGLPAMPSPKPVEMSLLEGLQGSLQIAHERVSRLEGLADRVFGPVPMAGGIDPPSSALADNLQVTARVLVERINSVLDRLERIA